MRPRTTLRTVRRGFAACGAAAVLAACGCLIALLGGDAGAATTDPRARRVLDEFVAGHLVRHPEEASRLGDHSRDSDLPLRSPSARSADAAWYRAQRESLASLVRTPLPPPLSVDARLLLARASREVQERDVEQVATRDPAWWLEPLDMAIADALRSFHASPCVRTTHLRRRLRAVPEYLRDARIALDSPDPIATQYALDRVELLLHRCRVELPRALEPCREARLQADLAEADSLTTAALDEFAAYLREKSAAGTDRREPRPARLRTRLEEVAGGPVNLDSLRAQLEQELAGLEASANDDPSHGRVDADSAEGLLEAHRRQLVKLKEIPATADLDFDLRERRPLRELGAVTTLGPWDPRGARSRLDATPRGPEEREWSGGVIDDNPLASPTRARITFGREAWPGRAWFAASEARLASPARQAFGLDPVREGWSRYAELLGIAFVPVSEQERATGIVAGFERARLARAIAELMLARGPDSLGAAARWLESALRLPPHAARRLALEAAEAPRWAASSYVRGSLIALRAEAGEQLGSRFDPAAFHTAVLREGAVPTAWVRASILASLHDPRGRR